VGPAPHQHPGLAICDFPAVRYDVQVAPGWYDVWLGAVTTALFFEIGKAAIEFNIGKQGLESTYGAAASIIVVLIWGTTPPRSF
jgi:Virulence factor BrkB